MHDDFATEPIPGLPETLPPGEVVLWQGRPDATRLARDSLWLFWVAGYFGVLIVWRVMASLADYPLRDALGHALPLALVGAAGCALIWGFAWVQARATLYTITSARVAMRVGAALSLTLNLPFRRIEGADLAQHRDGTGTIAFRTLGETRLSYLVLWPHVRPWRMKHPQPAFRAIPDAARVAAILADAAETKVSEPVVAARPAAAAVAAE
jgi:hypothetical protein